jgi:hypothetical protein
MPLRFQDYFSNKLSRHGKGANSLFYFGAPAAAGTALRLLPSVESDWQAGPAFRALPAWLITQSPAAPPAPRLPSENTSCLAA